MNFAQTPQGLQTLYSLPPEAVMSGMRLEDMMAQSDQMGIQNQQRQLQYDQQADPFRLQQMDIANQQGRAQLPGMVADSSMRQRKNANEELLNPDVIKQLRTKHSADQLKAYTDEISNVGQLYRQASQMIYDNPLGAGAQVKAALKKAGHEDMWNPAWDKFDAATLQKVLLDQGTQIGNMSTKFRDAMFMQDDKQQSAEAIAALKATTTKEVQTAKDAAALERAQLAKQKNASTAKGILDQVQAGKLTYEKAATAFKIMSSMTEDETDAAKYLLLAEQFEQAVLNKAKASKDGGLDLGGFPGPGGKPMPTIDVRPALGGKPAKSDGKTFETRIKLD